jgi:hypothetical protein
LLLSSELHLLSTTTDPQRLKPKTLYISFLLLLFNFMILERKHALFKGQCYAKGG